MKKSSKQIAAFKRRLGSKAGKTINKFNLIKKGELIVIGLSGGIDSLALADILFSRLKHTKLPYKLAAVHVQTDQVSYEIDTEYIQEFCKKRLIPFYLIKNSLPKNFEKSNKPICFICSWNRRKILFQKAQELGSKKIAFGHHMDDVVETLLLNMFFQGSVCSIPAKLSFFKGEMEIIRPLLKITKKEIEEFAVIQEYQGLKKECPFRYSTKRDYIRSILQDMEKLYPHVRNNIFNSIGNIQTEYLHNRSDIFSK